jgi:hypothetical protein
MRGQQRNPSSSVCPPWLAGKITAVVSLGDVWSRKVYQGYSGGTLTEDMIDKFKFDIIMGLANNQLRATGQSGETEMAGHLVNAGIFFVVECVYNIAGGLAGWAEYIFGEEASFAKIKPLIE